MIPWMMPASEAKVISDGNQRVRRALGLISQMIFERAQSGQSFLFVNTENIENTLLSSLDEEERKAVSDILFDYGYMMIPMYKENNRSDSKWHEDPGKRIAMYTSGHTGTTLIGYNIDWSGQYDE